MYEKIIIKINNCSLKPELKVKLINFTNFIFGIKEKAYLVFDVDNNEEFQDHLKNLVRLLKNYELSYAGLHNQIKDGVISISESQGVKVENWEKYVRKYWDEV